MYKNYCVHICSSINNDKNMLSRRSVGEKANKSVVTANRDEGRVTGEEGSE